MSTSCMYAGPSPSCSHQPQDLTFDSSNATLLEALAVDASQHKRLLMQLCLHQHKGKHKETHTCAADNGSVTAQNLRIMPAEFDQNRDS